MTHLLEEVLAALRRMPPQDQDEIARVLISMTRAMEDANRSDAAVATHEDADAIRLWPRRRRPRGAMAS